MLESPDTSLSFVPPPSMAFVDTTVRVVPDDLSVPTTSSQALVINPSQNYWNTSISDDNKDTLLLLKQSIVEVTKATNIESRLQTLEIAQGNSNSLTKASDTAEWMNNVEQRLETLEASQIQLESRILALEQSRNINILEYSNTEALLPTPSEHTIQPSSSEDEVLPDDPTSSTIQLLPVNRRWRWSLFRRSTSTSKEGDSLRQTHLIYKATCWKCKNLVSSDFVDNGLLTCPICFHLIPIEPPPLKFSWVLSRCCAHVLQAHSSETRSRCVKCGNIREVTRIQFDGFSVKMVEGNGLYSPMSLYPWLEKGRGAEYVLKCSGCTENLITFEKIVHGCITCGKCFQKYPVEPINPGMRYARIPGGFCDAPVDDVYRPDAPFVYIPTHHLTEDEILQKVLDGYSSAENTVNTEE